MRGAAWMGICPVVHGVICGPESFTGVLLVLVLVAEVVALVLDDMKLPLHAPV